MMSLIDLDDDQRWVPTHVNVTVLRARGLRTKSKHGSRYLYTIIQVGKEKYTTGLVEKAEMPEWNEECCYELLPGILEEDSSRSAHPPPGSGLLVLTVMHRVLIGLDVFLGQTIIPLQKIFQDGMCPRDEWFKLNSKAGRKEKERGELQVTVQFTRNNMTASMFDLTMKDKPRSTFGKLKDRVTGRKRGDMESSSAIVPGRYAALSGSLGQPFGEAMESTDAETAEEKKSKVKDFFKARLSKSSDTRSCSSLASDSSVFSIGSDNPAPPPSLELMSDPPSSPIYTSKVRVDPQYGDTALAKKVLTSQHTTMVLTHKRAFSDETRQITTGFPRPNPAVESLRGQTMTQSKSSLCINGSHVYDSESSSPKSSAAHASKMALLEKCSPLSRSLQNLTKRSEDKDSFSDNRRWSFDKKKEEKEEEKEAQTLSPPCQRATTGGPPLQAMVPDVSSTAGSSDKGKKLRKTLFSGGRSESLPAKSDQNQGPSASEGRLRGWFGSSDSQNKPRLEVSPKVESSSDVPPPLPQCSSSTTSPSGHVSSDDCNHTNPFTPSPSSTSISLSNPSPSHTQHNPFLEDLVAEESQRSPPFTTPSFHYTTSPFQHCTPGQVHDVTAAHMTYMKRERPRPVPRQTSLPAVLPKEASPEEWDESFDAFASSRLASPKGSLSQKQLVTTPVSSYSYVTANTNNNPQEQGTCEEKPPPLPPRRLLRTSVNEIYSDGWLHRGQELAVHKEAYLLSQTGVASRQRGREGESKRNSISPDPHTNSEASDSQQSTNITSQGSGEKLKRFKYEPLEDERDRWGGMLFEQDLYGRICRGNYGQVSLNSRHLSVNAEETSRNKIESMNSGPKMVRETPLADLRNIVPTPPSKLDEKVLDTTTTPIEETESKQTENINNNVSLSLTTGDLNMNVNNSDLSFIDSDCSSHSEVVDAPKGINSFGGTFLKPLENSLIATYHVIKHKNLPPLKDTYIREVNSSFEITAPSNKRCKVSSACRGNCQDCRCALTNFVPQGHCRVDGKQNQTSDPPGLEPVADITNPDVSKKAPKDFDDNGNPQDQRGNQAEPYSGVVSARFRPKGVSRQSSSSSLNSKSKSGDREFEQLLSLVQNISGDSEGPFSYQPTKSALSNLLVVNKQKDLQGDSTNQDQTHESDLTPQILSKDDKVFPVKENGVIGKSFEISFEDLHAKVAPNSRTPSGSVQTLQELESPSPSDEAQGTLHPKPFSCPSMHPSSLGPSASSSTFSYHLTTSTSDQLPVDARHSLLPEETHPASNLPHQESRPHPVKPLTSSLPERKESRSVLEKLKSTIHPGRSTQQVEPERSQQGTADRSAQYQHLTNMELISLLLQQEMDMQKQQAASQQQEAKLQKCEAELKKVKLQVGELEDYIDNLLLRIMEQTPTLLQVRTRHK